MQFLTTLVDSLADLWHRVLSTQVDPPARSIAITGVLALLAVVVDGIWRRARHVVTIAHEGGHALLAVLTGRRLRGIRLHSDTSGLTLSSGKPTGLGMALTLLAGYLAPSLLGLGAAVLLADGRITLLLWITLALLLAMLLMIRNWYGVLAILVTGLAVFAVSWFTSAAVQALFVYLGTWFLLIGGVRPVGEVARQRRRGGARSSDPDQLARLTRVPGPVWVGLFGLVNMAALAFGGYLLAGPVVAAYS